MTSPFIAVHRQQKSAVIRTDVHRVLKVFRGKSARRRAESFLDAVLIGWFSRK